MRRAAVACAFTLALLLGSSQAAGSLRPRSDAGAPQSAGVVDQALTPARGQLGISDGAAIVSEADSTRRRELDSMRRLGAKWTRYDFAWSVIEPSKGRYRFSYLERAVREAKSRGLSTVAMLGYAPGWANGGHDDKYPPVDPAAYGEFAGKVAKRFSRLGVHVYELWNEPNTATFFKPSPNPDLYAAMVKTAYSSIKRADRRATVLAGSLSPAGRFDDVNCDGVSDGGSQAASVNPITFLERLYHDGAGSSFDAVSVHPYDSGGFVERCSAWPQMQDTQPSLRSVMAANGDGAKRLWATEYGNMLEWVGGSERAAAARLAEAISRWRNYPWAGPLFVFNLWDARGSPFGLLRPDWSRRPAWFAFKAQAAGAGHSGLARRMR